MWKILPKEYGSGSTCHRRFQQWSISKVFQRLWSRLLKVYDGIIIGIQWRWQVFDSSISIKAHLDGNEWLALILQTEVS